MLQKKIVNRLLLEQNRVRSIPWRLATNNEKVLFLYWISYILIHIYQYNQSKNVFLFFLP